MLFETEAIMEKDFSSVEYKRSRNAYTMYAMFEYFVALLVADSFLAKLLKSVGFGDGDVGIISSFISLAFVFQLFSLFLARKRGSKKVMILVLDAIGQVLFWHCISCRLSVSTPRTGLCVYRLCLSVQVPCVNLPVPMGKQLRRSQQESRLFGYEGDRFSGRWYHLLARRG